MSSYEEIVVDRNINDGWKMFRARLADHLLSDAFAGVIDLVPAEKDAGVLIVPESDGLVSVLAVIDKPGTAGTRTLRTLGFRRDHDEWTMALDRRYADQAAHATYVVLHELLQVIHPSLIDIDPLGLDLWDDLADEAPAPVVVPALAYPNDAEGLQTLVDATLEPTFGHPPVKDDDGDIRITNDEGGCAYISVRSAATVEVWTILAVDVDLAKARREVDRLSAEYSLHKFYVWNRCLVAAFPLFAQPYVAELLHGAIGGTLYVSAEESAGLSVKLQRSTRRGVKARQAQARSEYEEIDDESGASGRGRQQRPF